MTSFERFASLVVVRRSESAMTRIANAALTSTASSALASDDPRDERTRFRRPRCASRRGRRVPELGRSRGLAAGCQLSGPRRCPHRRVSSSRSNGLARKLSAPAAAASPGSISLNAVITSTAFPQVRVRADLADDVEAADAGQHDVEEDDVGLHDLCDLDCLLAADGARDVELLAKRRDRNSRRALSSSTTRIDAFSSRTPGGLLWESCPWPRGA